MRRRRNSGRRAALAGLGAILSAGAARAQISGRPAKVAILYLADTAPSQLEAFRRRLAALGWIDGQNLSLIGTASRGYEDVRAVVPGIVAAGVDVLVARGGDSARAARGATATVPIVAITSIDLIADGFAASIARPGGNLTAISTASGLLVDKRVELLRECLPGFRRLAAVYSPDTPAGLPALRYLKAVGTRLGFTVEDRPVRRLDDLDEAVAQLAAGSPAALISVSGTLLETSAMQRRLAELAQRHRLPGMFIEPEAVRAGGLLSYGVDIAAIWARAADYVDRILRGTKPGDLPIEQPMRFHLVVNLATARALGIVIPPTVIVRADEVIE